MGDRMDDEGEGKAGKDGWRRCVDSGGNTRLTWEISTYFTSISRSYNEMKSIMLLQFSVELVSLSNLI